MGSTGEVATRPETIRLLLIDDDEDEYFLTRDLLSEFGAGRYSLDWIPSYAEALETVCAGEHDLYLLDYSLGAQTGLDLLREAQRVGSPRPVILLTGAADHKIDVEAMHAGAADFLPKSSMDGAILERSIRFAIERRRAEDELRRMRDELEDRVRDRTAALEEANARLVAEISERRRAEGERENLLILERQARADAEAANLAKDRFIAMLSHELRTPLNPVLLVASSLVEDPTTPDAIRPVMEMIRDKIELESRLIEDLLDVTRIGQGKLRVQTENVDVHSLIRSSIEICQPDATAAGLTLSAELHATRFHTEADPARIQQVLWNLIKNATKFTPRGGSITILTRDEDDRLVVTCRDTGMGISPEATKRIFEAFEQADSEIHRLHGGLGLGLAISRSIVEAHGGTLSVASEGLGKGATFEFFLQSRAPSDSSRPQPDRSAPADHEAPARRILLVDDDARSLSILARLLRSQGHSVHEADSAAAAIATFDRIEFDLILSDLGLPDLSGVEMLQRMIARRKVPAVAITGFGSDQDVLKAREAGFNAHLTKPIKFAELRTIIRDLT